MAEENEPENEGESQVIRSINFIIVDLSAFNTEGKEAQFIQIDQAMERMTGEIKTTEDNQKDQIKFLVRPKNTHCQIRIGR